MFLFPVLFPSKSVQSPGSAYICCKIQNTKKQTNGYRKNTIYTFFINYRNTKIKNALFPSQSVQSPKDQHTFSAKYKMYILQQHLSHILQNTMSAKKDVWFASFSYHFLSHSIHDILKNMFHLDDQMFYLSIE